MGGAKDIEFYLHVIHNSALWTLKPLSLSSFPGLLLYNNV